MARYYEKSRLTVDSEILVDFIKRYRNCEKESLDKLNFDGHYKQLLCKIREDMNIKNIMQLGIVSMKSDEKEVVLITIYDYELPKKDWNSWCETKFDEEKQLKYIEVEE